MRFGCLSPVAFTIFGFGDSSYPKFNWTARKLQKRLEQLGAREVYGRGEADEQHEEGTDGAFLPWSRDLKNWLLENYPLPGGLESIPDDQFLEPKFVLKIDSEAAADITTTNASLASDHVHVPAAAETAAVLEPAPPPAAEAPSDSDEIEPAAVAPLSSLIDSQASELQAQNLSSTTTEADFDIPPSLLLPIPDSHTLTLSSITRLTPEKHWQDVRQLTLTYPGHLSYKPGDIVTIYPKNFPSDVSKLIRDQEWEAVADLPINIRPNPARPSSPISHSHNDGTEGQPPVDPTLPQSLTLRNLLLHTLDISKIPSRYFLELCAYFSDDPDHKERLQEFSNPAFSDEYYDYCTRPRRSILEVLSDFHSVKLPWRYVLCILPRMRGRQFSIASGGALKYDAQKDLTHINVLVALVKYRTVLRKIREGLCSRYIAALPLGTELKVTIQKASWDITQNNYAMLREPLLCVGPGTGVAPIRALFQERAAVLGDKDGEEDRSKAVLIYGGRNKHADFFYGDEWPLLGVECLAAWSRDQREKVYVQDIIRQQPGLVWECIGPSGVVSRDKKVGGGGTFFVCGSSGKMPIAVRAAIIDALCEGCMEKEAAEAHLRAMEKGNRYLQETW